MKSVTKKKMLIMVAIVMLYMSNFPVSNAAYEPVGVLNYEQIMPLQQVRIIAAPGQTGTFGWFHIDCAVAGRIAEGPMGTGRTVPGGTLGNVVNTDRGFVRVQTQGFGTLWFMQAHVRTN